MALIKYEYIKNNFNILYCLYLYIKKCITRAL
jgi:hypothetical protein